jgi:arylsulfatase A-like enzyme
MRPNILLITADQCRGDSLGVAGHPVVRTPNLDRLAARGTYFAQHYAQTAPCGPSRASLYTGLYQMNHRVVRNGTPLDNRFDNIARAMRRLGYRPTMFGHTDQAIDPRTATPGSPWLRTYEGILPGFHVGLRLANDPEPWLAWLADQGIARPDDFREIDLPVTGSSAEPVNAPPRYNADQTQTAFLTDVFLGWLAEQRAGEPWFAHLSYLSPHPPFVVPEPFNTLYDPASGQPFHRRASAEEERAQHPLIDYWHDQTLRESYITGAGGGRVADWRDEDFRVIRAVYWGMISEVDRQLGRILDGADDNTIIAFTSDHGEMLGDHWTLGKFGYYDQSFHVPLIISDRRRSAFAGTKVEAFTESIDVMPTLIELSGGRPAGTLDGHSLAPFLEGRTPPSWREAVHWEYDFREVATGVAQSVFGLDMDSCSLAVYRDARFKYVHFAGLKPLLFDLASDPGELMDLSDEPGYAAIRLECAEKLLAWRAQHLDRTLTGIELTSQGPVDARL